MTREEIKAILKDISDEQVNSILDLNSRDIGKVKGKTEDQKTELENLRRQLAEKDETIANLEKAKGDAAAIQRSLTSTSRPKRIEPRRRRKRRWTPSSHRPQRVPSRVGSLSTSIHAPIFGGVEKGHPRPSKQRQKAR